MNPSMPSQDSPEPRTSLLKRFIPLVVIVGLCWVVFLINNLLLNGHLNQYGIVPRRVASLTGIIWAPFLHSSFQHLLANTVPLLVLGAIICARSRSEFALVAFTGTVLTGALTWLFARNASHIGASGLIFCFFGYLTSMAYFRRTFGALVLAVVCLFAYGGMLKGILPTSTPVSWEGHLAGLAAGIALAWVASKLNPQRKEPEVKPTQLDEILQK